jgi:hypothetical protein
LRIVCSLTANADRIVTPHRRRRDPFKPLISPNGMMGPPRRSWSRPRAETH